MLREENETLKSEVEELRRKNREFAELKEKNDELRRALNLKAEFADYTIAGANIIAVEPGNWFSVFKVDVGERDGIHVDFPVVTGSRGLIGRVLDTDISTSNIQTIIDEESAVSGWIAKPGGGHAIVKGDLQLKEEGLCKLVYIPIEIDIEVGDIIETSGVGGIYPKGIEIGTVIEVRKTNSEFDRYAIIQPTADFKRLEEVFILKSENMMRQAVLSNEKKACSLFFIIFLLLMLQTTLLQYTRIRGVMPNLLITLTIVTALVKQHKVLLWLFQVLHRYAVGPVLDSMRCLDVYRIAADS